MSDLESIKQTIENNIDLFAKKFAQSIEEILQTLLKNREEFQTLSGDFKEAIRSNNDINVPTQVAAKLQHENMPTAPDLIEPRKTPGLGSSGSDT